MIKCPICDKDLIKVYSYSDEQSEVEFKYSCTNCNLYSETFEYGNTEIMVGDFMTVYSYTISDEKRADLNKKILGIAKLYRKR